MQKKLTRTHTQKNVNKIFHSNSQKSHSPFKQYSNTQIWLWVLSVVFCFFFFPLHPECMCAPLHTCMRLTPCTHICVLTQCIYNQWQKIDTVYCIHLLARVPSTGRDYGCLGVYKNRGRKRESRRRRGRRKENGNMSV